MGTTGRQKWTLGSMTHIRRCPLLAAHRRIPRRLILHPILHRLEDYETRAADCLLFIGEQRLGKLDRANGRAIQLEAVGELLRGGQVEEACTFLKRAPSLYGRRASRRTS